ncbi:MAG: glycosyltransferase family 2 protein [Candidatus Nanoarchaeia archaeon]|nr:glycosyltransferase family 2 protein [Candidatus Nanoarchaeia archaeon]
MNLAYAVGIPVRNEENTIIQTIESVLNQSVSPKEIHICVNGSSDNTYNLVQDMAKVEKSINLITSEPGKPNAWNKIVSESSENKIMFCDGDVLICNKAGENLSKRLEDKNLIIVGGSKKYFEPNTLKGKYLGFRKSEKITKINWISGSLYMVKIKELFDLAQNLKVEVMPKDIICEDSYLDLITQGYKEIIESAYNISRQVETFKDWNLSLQRSFVGKKQLKEKLPDLQYGNLSMKKLSQYYYRLNQFEGIFNKFSALSLHILGRCLRKYYEKIGKPDIGVVWPETKSTKRFYN